MSYIDSKVALLNGIDNDFFDRLYAFEAVSGMFGRDKTYDEYAEHVNNDMAFLKFLREHRLTFRIDTISRIALSQITRDRAIFCANSHGAMVITQDAIIPTVIAHDETLGKMVADAHYMLNAAYTLGVESNIDLDDLKYLLPIGQTMSVTMQISIEAFCNACRSRTNLAFANELNIVYRKMIYEVLNAIKNLKNDDSARVFRRVLTQEKLIDTSEGWRYDTYYDSMFDRPKVKTKDKTPKYDFMKNSMIIDIINNYDNLKHLFTDFERQQIERWIEHA